MAVLRVTRLKGGEPSEMEAIASDAKHIWLELGAEEFTFYRFETGSHAGETLLIQRFPDWASLGKAMDQRAANPNYAETLGRALRISEVLSIDYLSDVDL